MTTPNLEDLDLATLPELASNQAVEGEEDNSEDTLEYAKDQSKESDPSDDTSKSESQETSKQSTDEDSKEPDEKEPDYKALFEESEARAKSLENRVKTNEGRAKAQEARDAEIAKLSDGLAATTRMVQAFVSAQAPDSNVDLGQEITKIQGETAQAAQIASIDRQTDTIKEALAQAAHDEEDNLLLTKEQVAEVAAEWKAAVKVLEDSKYRDFSALTETVLMTSKMAIANQRASLKTQETEAKTKKAEEKKESDAESGVGDLDLGPASGSASDLDSLSARELIERGLASDKQSKVFD